MKNGLWDSLANDRLLWLPELECGFYPVADDVRMYDRTYFETYRRLDATDCGAKLTAMRIDLVRGHWDGDITDIGIGGGRFVLDFPGEATGYDINPDAIELLRAQNLYHNPYAAPVDAISCWDSLEHIDDPRRLLDCVRSWVFVSIPIFADSADVIRSKHYKKDEHYWYFTRRGFERFMNDNGFTLIESNLMEQTAGREQIESFAFRR